MIFAIGDRILNRGISTSINSGKKGYVTKIGNPNYIYVAYDDGEKGEGTLKHYINLTREGENKMAITDQGYHSLRVASYDMGCATATTSINQEGTKRMRSLSVIQKLTLSKEDQTLLKAGYLCEDLSLSTKGTQALMATLWQVHKAEMVKLAQAELDEEKESK